MERNLPIEKIIFSNKIHYFSCQRVLFEEENLMIIFFSFNISKKRVGFYFDFCFVVDFGFQNILRLIYKGFYNILM